MPFVGVGGVEVVFSRDGRDWVHTIPFPHLHPLSNDPLAFMECNPHLQHLHSQCAYHAEVLRTLICGAFFYMLDAHGWEPLLCDHYDVWEVEEEISFGACWP